MPYAKKEEILTILLKLRPDYTVININDQMHALATADVNAVLVERYIFPPVDDLHSLLKRAEICFYLEQAGMTREIENAFGVLRNEKVGSYSKQYENGMPMFFFAQGSSAPFFALLPHETWRMRGYKYATVYTNAYFEATKATLSKYSYAAHDTTGRGYNWKETISDYDYTLEEWT